MCLSEAREAEQRRAGEVRDREPEPEHTEHTQSHGLFPVCVCKGQKVTNTDPTLR